MPTALHLPESEGEATQVGRQTYRKQLLPVGSLEYEGRTLNFDRSYLTDLAAKFNEGAFDQVPFVLVDDRNNHSDNPELFRGEVKAMEVADDGLYGLIDLTEEGAKLIGDNPKLGVSPRIREDVGAIEHVAGTLRPRTEGMGVKPWEQVELSDDVEVVDLTAAEFAGVSDPPSTSSSRTVTETATKSPEELLADWLAGNGSESAPKPAELSDSDKQAIELARSESESARREAREAREELAQERFERLRDNLVAKGVPPAEVNLAEPILKGGSGTIELSNGEKADAHSIVTKLLESREGTVPLTELSAGGGEEGSEQAEAKELAEKWAKASSGVSE